MKNEKGIALLTTLVLGFIALAFIGALLYMLTSGTQMSKSGKVYTTALEAAKGGADLVITKIISNQVECGGVPCTPCPISPNNNCKIDLDVSQLGNYQLDAYLLSRKSFISAGTNYYLYAIRVIATNPNANEKAEIEFVYKVE